MSSLSQDTFVQLAELQKSLEQGVRATVVDVRSLEEFAAGHVAGAINIPADQLLARAGEIPADAPVVTVCNFGGARSCGAAEQLRASGREDVSVLHGGMAAWDQSTTDKGEPA